jgi:hypothetical protein
MGDSLSFTEDLLGEFSVFRDEREGSDRKTFGSSSTRYSVTITQKPKADLTPVCGESS